MRSRKTTLSGLCALCVLCLALVNAAAMRAVFSPLQQAAQLEFGLSDLQISFVQGIAASLPAAILALPLGRLVDQTNRVRLMLAVSLVWTLGTFLTAYANGFVTLYVARMLAGSGAICALPISISLAADLARPERRGRAILFLSVGATVGTAIAFAAAGALCGVLKTAPHGPPVWRLVQFIFGCASAASTAPLLFLREPLRQDVLEGQRVALATAACELWRLRALLIPLMLGQVAAVMADSAAGVWAAPLLTRNFGLRPDQFGGWLALVVLIPGLLGSIIGGAGADLGFKRAGPSGVLVGGVAASVAALPGAAFSFVPSAGGFAWLLSLLLLCGAVMGLATSAAIAQLVPNQVRGLCLGLMVVVSALLGFGLAPSLAPLLEATLHGLDLGGALAIVNISAGLVSCAGFLFAAQAGLRLNKFARSHS